MTSPTPSVYLFVINPISGGKHKKNHEDAIKEYFAPLSQSIEFLLLNGKNDAAELDNRIEQLKPQKVIAVGGDGTVSLVAEKLLGTQMQLGIIPAGSANGLARELKISEDTEEALKIVQQDNIGIMDAICINDIICFHLSDIGLNARLIKHFERGKMRGILGYALVALKLVFKRQNMRVIIKNGDDVLKRNACMIVIANASKYGTGAVINPSGNIGDGLFEVVIVKTLSFITFLKMWFSPDTADPKDIEVIQCSSVHIETYKSADFQVDGEYHGKIREVNAEIVAGQLNILLP